MTLTRLKAVLAQQPFEPFILNLADGRHFEIRHPEMVQFYGKERSFAVYQDERIHVTDSILVVDIEFAEMSRDASATLTAPGSGPGSEPG